MLRQFDKDRDGVLGSSSSTGSSQNKSVEGNKDFFIEHFKELLVLKSRNREEIKKLSEKLNEAKSIEIKFRGNNYVALDINKSHDAEAWKKAISEHEKLKAVVEDLQERFNMLIIERDDLSSDMNIIASSGFSFMLNPQVNEASKSGHSNDLRK